MLTIVNKSFKKKLVIFVWIGKLFCIKFCLYFNQKSKICSRHVRGMVVELNIWSQIRKKFEDYFFIIDTFQNHVLLEKFLFFVFRFPFLFSLSQFLNFLRQHTFPLGLWSTTRSTVLCIPLKSLVANYV